MIIIINIIIKITEVCSDNYDKCLSAHLIVLLTRFLHLILSIPPVLSYLAFHYLIWIIAAFSESSLALTFSTYSL